MSTKPYYKRKKAPVTHPWRRECKSRKIRYASAEEALVAAHLRPERGGDQNAARPYRCPHCDGWHVTKQPPRT